MWEDEEESGGENMHYYCGKDKGLTLGMKLKYRMTVSEFCFTTLLVICAAYGNYSQLCWYVRHMLPPRSFRCMRIIIV